MTAKTNLNALTIAQLAKLLGANTAAVEADIQAGFWPNPDGTIHFICYAAWLSKKHGRFEEPDSLGDGANAEFDEGA